MKHPASYQLATMLLHHYALLSLHTKPVVQQLRMKIFQTNTDRQTGREGKGDLRKETPKSPDRQRLKMSSEKFSLKWNDFEKNISSTFRELRSEKDLFDCTLSCGSRKVQAHKLILSACSNFFRSVFRDNVHQHPLIYLRGVTYSDMVSALDFMYHGEVSVAQTNLNSFLALAEDLEIKGLTQNNGGPTGNTQRVKPSEVRGRRAVSAGNNESSDDLLEIKSEAATSQATVSFSEGFQDPDPAFYDSQHHPPGDENSYPPLDASQGKTQLSSASLEWSMS